MHGSRTISIPETDSWQTYNGYVDISITSTIDPAGSPYDLYAKIDGVISPILESVITVAGPPITPELRNLQIVSYDSPLESGDRCRVTVRFDYRGPSISKRIYAAIGNSGWAGFDEILHGSRTISIPQSANWETYEGYANINITSAIDPEGSPYDLYAKIDSVISPVLQSVIIIESEEPPGPTEPEFRNLVVHMFPSSVVIGGICMIMCRWDYQGPAISRTLYAAIGNDGFWGFDEIIAGSSALNIPETPSWTTHYGTVFLTITSAISPAGSPYDIYCKLDSIISPVKKDAITVR
ncbi:hypothetical protein ES703_100903 [subsurface metagenome]